MRQILLALCLWSAAVQSSASEREVMLLVQGAGIIPSPTEAEETWGELVSTRSGKRQWTGYIGHLRESGCKFGGVLRATGKLVRPDQLDNTGADQPSGDFYLLSSSLVVQRGDMFDRAREISSAVAAVRQLTKNKEVTLVCYSAGGIAARAWMQGAVTDAPYHKGDVKHLVTVASPHFGLGAAARLVAKFSSRYRQMAIGSELLHSLNEGLDLPPEARYSSVIFQSGGPAVFDSGRKYVPHLRLSEKQVQELPLLLRQGHDGFVHSLSGQLHLAPAAARYEKATNRPVGLFVCFIPEQRETLHTAALQHAEFYCTLDEVLSGDDRQRKEAALAWARQISRFDATSKIVRSWPGTRILDVNLVRCQQSTKKTDNQFQWTVETLIRKPFNDNLQTIVVRGSFGLTLDRFNRPVQLSKATTELNRP